MAGCKRQERIELWWTWHGLKFTVGYVQYSSTVLLWIFKSLGISTWHRYMCTNSAWTAKRTKMERPFYKRCHGCTHAYSTVILHRIQQSKWTVHTVATIYLSLSNWCSKSFFTSIQYPWNKWKSLTSLPTEKILWTLKAHICLKLVFLTTHLVLLHFEGSFFLQYCMKILIIAWVWTILRVLHLPWVKSWPFPSFKMAIWMYTYGEGIANLRFKHAWSKRET